MSDEEEDTFMSYEEEDTCMSYEEEDTFLQRFRPLPHLHCPERTLYRLANVGRAVCIQDIFFYVENYYLHMKLRSRTPTALSVRCRGLQNCYLHWKLLLLYAVEASECWQSGL
jgi:hypothetical protein